MTARATETAAIAENAENAETVRAAGGIVARAPKFAPVAGAAGAGSAELLVIHRPGHGDWSLPKGKLDDGESWEQAAVREVHEETGLVVRATRFVAAIHYVDAHRRPKEVRYFEMQILGDEPFTPTSEVDEVRWCHVDRVGELLSYDTDRAVVEAWRLGPDPRPGRAEFE